MISKNTPSQVLAWADKESKQRSFVYRIIHSMCRIALITAQEFKKNELSLRAGALTYAILLSLVPILAMSTAVVKGLGGGDQLRQMAYSYVETFEPDNSAPDIKTAPEKLPDAEQLPDSEQLSGTAQAPSNLSKHLYSAVDKIFNYVDRTNFATLGTIGVLGIFLSVVLVFGNIETAMNTIWHVENGRPIMRKVADYLALVVLMPISINIGFAASAVLKSEALLSKFNIILPMVWIQAIILKFIPIFFLALTLYVIYIFFPHTKVKSIPALAGALFASFFWFEVQNIYIGLQVGVSKYNAIYGSFATLPLFLVWMYFGWIFILCGAQIGFAFQNKDSYRLNRRDVTPSLRLSLAFDVIEYVRRSFTKETPASTETFQDNFPEHPSELVGEVISTLIDHGLIHISSSDSTLHPSGPSDLEDQERIITAVMGSGFSRTDGGTRSREALEAATRSCTCDIPHTSEVSQISQLSDNEKEVELQSPPNDNAIN